MDFFWYKFSTNKPSILLGSKSISTSINFDLFSFFSSSPSSPSSSSSSTKVYPLERKRKLSSQLIRISLIRATLIQFLKLYIGKKNLNIIDLLNNVALTSFFEITVCFIEIQFQKLAIDKLSPKFASKLMKSKAFFLSFS